MTQLDNPPAVPLSRSSDPAAAPRFGATALDEELRFHFEFLGSHWENTADDVATVGGEGLVGFLTGFYGWIVYFVGGCLLGQDVVFQNLTS